MLPAGPLHFIRLKAVSDTVISIPTATDTTSREATMSENTDHVQISARVPADLAEGLGRAATEADRTLSAELRRALRHYLEVQPPGDDVRRAA
jgi:hypothetical protein